MKILVTGGAGFIGSALCQSLLKSGHSMIVIDNLSAQIHGAIPSVDLAWMNSSDIEFIRADIRDAKVMDDALARVDAVVHLAAETGTGQSMYQIAHYYEVNQQATAQMCEAIGTRHQHIQRIVLASSRSIYGEGAYKFNEKIVVPQPREAAQMKLGDFEVKGPAGEKLELIPTPENAQPMPASIYAATKLANEALGRIFSDAYQKTVFALRFQNVYGERQSLKNPYTGILSIFSNRMRKNLPINIFEDGEESRDFVHVSDVVKGIELALFSNSLQGFHTLNVGSGVPTSVLQVADILRRLLGSTSEFKVTGDFRAGDIRHCYADLSKSREILGYAPSISLEDGLQRFCDWVLTQPVLEDRSDKAMEELTKLGLGSKN